VQERLNARLATVLGATFAVACTSRSAPSADGSSAGAAQLHPNVDTRTRQETIDREPLSPLPAAPKLDPRLVALGRRLFHEKRLSSDETIACASCHDLANGGDDGRQVSLGVQGRVGRVNAPTVYNAALNFVLFWDGRAKTLEEQVGGPMTSAFEMNSPWSDVVGKLRNDPEYARSFAEIFADGVTAENARSAIAAFERRLLTPESPFDRWLQGNESALTPDQEEGYQTFKSAGCVACHQGANVGGNMFQRFGLFGDYFKDRGQITDADYGRFNVTGNEADRFVFRVPSLRNVEHTAPYFHDGSAPTLERAIQVMAKYQLGRELSARQVAVIQAFLESLSGATASADGP
jgi:cytochrome c peroxidase